MYLNDEEKNQLHYQSGKHKLNIIGYNLFSIRLKNSKHQK